MWSKVDQTAALEVLFCERKADDPLECLAKVAIPPSPKRPPAPSSNLIHGSRRPSTQAFHTFTTLIGAYLSASTSVVKSFELTPMYPSTVSTVWPSLVPADHARQVDVPGDQAVSK
ncbi:hypothetical protein CKAH01_05607 [Colletotrichum kahawae]|uniref:Uncharacterized protein n=1 Tax=Colletotrichum kahawae TaxID=34407 RepID=A0AAE0D5Q4_COLKA|nr:hypothetical protein CKAH01_05607 [Colletotrichum kahawae]